MTNARSNTVAAYYTLAQIDTIAERDFPDELSAIIDADELPWQTETYDTTTICAKSLFIGYIEADDGIIVRVSAYMTLGGAVNFYARGAKLSRKDCAHIYLQEPWNYLQEAVQRPALEKLKVLCGYYFLAAQLADRVWVDKPRFFKTLKMAFKLVGKGLGTLPMQPTSLLEVGADIADLATPVEEQRVEVLVMENGGAVQQVNSLGGVHGWGRNEERLDEGDVARILQRLVGYARGRNEHWAEHVEVEWWRGRV